MIFWMGARASLIFLILCNAVVVFSTAPVQAQTQQKTILKDIKIDGNMRVEDDGIRLHLKSRTGEAFDPAIVDQDVKAIYRMRSKGFPRNCRRFQRLKDSSRLSVNPSEAYAANSVARETFPPKTLIFFSMSASDCTPIL